MNDWHFVPRIIPGLALAGLFLSLGGVHRLPAQEEGSAKGVPPGYVLIEGDILVRVPTPGTTETKAPHPASASDYWPGGVVRYVYDDNVIATNRTLMGRAFGEWERVANVSFLPRSGQDDYIHIQDSDENSSEVGRTGGRQIVNIHNWGSHFIMVHELGHTLGFWHEQSRSDRDTYVQINTANIEDGAEHNFNRHDEANHYGPYDFDSLMHYSACAFSTCATCGTNTPGCWTITVRPPFDTEWQHRIGQRNHLSQWDQLIMSFLYPKTDWRFVDTTRSGSGSGRFIDPYKFVSEAEASVPDYGTVFLLQPGDYPAGGIHSKPMTVRATLGSARLRN